MAHWTRRSLLKSVAVGATATAAGGAFADAAGAAPAGPTALRLRLSGVGVRRIDVPARPRPGVIETDAPGAGERCVVIGTLAGSAGLTGTFHADVVRLHDRGQSPHSGTASTLEHHLFSLPDGTLAGTGTADLHGRGTFAIVAGTGRFTGCHGTYVSRQNRSDLGGDGTASFDFSVELGGTTR